MNILQYLLFFCGFGAGFCLASYYWTKRIKELKKQLGESLI